MRELDVFLSGRHIGKLQQTRKGARFGFDGATTEAYAGRPLLSVALPVRAKPYAEGLSNAWFEGLLPEGDRLDRISRELGISPSDYVGLLAEIGWECAGAVQVMEPGQTISANIEPEPLCEEELASKLRALPSFFAEHGLVRVSLGGYQEKLCVVANNVEVARGRVAKASFAMPNAATVSTHILKPQPSSKYPHLIEAETWAMHAVKHAARCANVALLDLEDAPLALMVERFDRAFVDGRPLRLHQEDCCQAMGLDPRGKYASTGGAKGNDPSYAKIAKLLVRYAADPDAELAELLRQMVVNLALGNVDAHAKNYAFLYAQECLPKLSPLYDIAPVVDIEPQARHLSLRIGSRMLAEEVGRADLLAEAESWGLPKATATSILEETLELLTQGVAQADSLYPKAAERHSANTLERMERL